ncbi:MAG: dicarboxylate/amino acid:cation symporter [Halobacteriovoraceae bacterium]|nr:dicarboxylate/amino acid:cation symporter [Halobacteriovoraceae bacterium]
MHQDSKKEAQRIGYAILLGLLAGLALHYTNMGEYSAHLKPIGDIFIRCLKMVIIPLVFSSIYMSITNLGSPETLGSMGKKAVGYYFVTTAIAVFLGIVFVNLINPGVGADLGGKGLENVSDSLAQKISEQKGLFQTIVEVVVDAIPSNPISAMADGVILQVIVFAVLLGIVAIYYPKKAGPVSNLLKSLEEMSLALTHGIMRFAPYGVFVLMMDVMAKSGFSAIVSLSKYILTVLVGLTCHGIVLLIVACVKLKKSPIYILKNLSAPILTSFSTSSSAATLPVTMMTVEENLKVNKDTAKFVLPLGATINMDGTALYESVAAIFIAQAYNIDLSVGQQVVVFLTASLAAIGAAAIPGAGLITMSIVLGAVGLPIEGIGLILAVDRILDMFRTTVNVFGDCVGTVVVDSMLKKRPTKKKA